MKVSRRDTGRSRAVLATLLGIVALVACGDGTGFVVAADEGVVEIVDFVDVVPEEVRATEIGQVVQFTAIPVDVRGDIVEGVAIEWSSSEPSIATVSQSGVATTYQDGQTEIRATAGDVTGVATLTVAQQLDPPPG